MKQIAAIYLPRLARSRLLTSDLFYRMKKGDRKEGRSDVNDDGHLEHRP